MPMTIFNDYLIKNRNVFQVYFSVASQPALFEFEYLTKR